MGIQSGSTLTSEQDIAHSRVRFDAYRTRSGLLRFLATNPAMVPHMIRTALKGAIGAVKQDHVIRYRMELQALHDVCPDAMLGQNVWGDIDTFVALFASVAKPTARCLEIGVGGGRLTARIAPMVAELTAQDVSNHNFDEVRRVTEGLGRINFMVAQGHGDNLPDAAYDIVACTDVMTLLDVQDLMEYTHNVHRALVPGGHFVASGKTIDDAEEIEVYLNFFDTGFGQKIHRLPTALYTRLFERQGFVVKRLVRNTAAEERGAHNGLHMNFLLQKPATKSSGVPEAY